MKDTERLLQGSISTKFSASVSRSSVFGLAKR